MQALEVAREPYRPIEWPQLQLETNWKISFLVFTAHLLALWLIAFSAHMQAPKKTPKKLIVHTVTLQSTPTTYAPKVAAAPKPQAAEKRIEKATTPPAIEPAVEKSAEPEKPAEAPKVIVEEEVTPAPIPQEPQKAKPTPQLANKTPTKPKEPALAKAEKKPSKPVAKAPSKPVPAKPAPAKPKPEVKKKEQPKAKSNDQNAQKEKAAKEAKAKEAAAQKKATQEKAAQERAAKEKAAKAQAAKQQAMLDKALSSLDSSGAIGGKKSTLAASAAKAAVSGPSAITSLSAESLVAIDATETANCTPAERTYYDELVSRLKLALKLPEFGEVKLQLTINRQGKVLTVKSVKSKSTKNSDYIQKALPKLHLPPFGQNFTGEKEHTFRLTLSNELNY